MAHFAELDQNNTVTRVIVVSNEDIKDVNGVESEELGIAFCRRLFGLNTNWRQTSYNGNTRFRYAAVGHTYDEILNAFIPPKPYPSWILDTAKADWKAPISPPELTASEEENKQCYQWNEETQMWELALRPQ